MKISRRVASILWPLFVLMMVPRMENIVADPENKIIDCEKSLDSQTRQFPRKSKANKLQSDLKYSQKPLWSLQWLMTEETLEVANHFYSPSMNIAEMHNIDVKGEGVGVVILGNSPVNCRHASIQGRCAVDDLTTRLSIKRKSLLAVFKPKPKPSAPDTISSEVAGIIGMNDNDDTGGVGIAPKCQIAYVVIDRSSKYGSPEYCAAKIISGNTTPTEVFVHAWNRREQDYIRSILYASDLNLLNFKDPQTVLKPHVMGSGKNGMVANSCQCYEYANADSMFVFGGVTYQGYLVPTSESCASLFGVTYSTSDGCYFYDNMVTISSVDSTSYVCASKSETTSSVAVAGGIITLIIDYYKKRFKKPPSVSDLAFLLAFSLSSKKLLDTNILWFSNGAGLMYSQQAGFGLPDMVNVATLIANWIPMEFPVIYEVTRFTKEIKFKCEHDSGRRTLTYSSNLTCHFSIHNAHARYSVQLVSVELSAKLVKRGALTVYLISPAGTVSCILEGRPYDITNKKYHKLLLRSNHFIGELLGGQWSLRFYTYQEDSKPIGSEEALTPAENDEKQPSDTKPLDEKNDSNLSRQLSGSDSDASVEVGKSDSSDTESPGPEGDKPHSPKKDVTFNEVVTIIPDKTSPQNAPVDNVVSEQHPTDPQPAKSILKSASSTGNRSKPSRIRRREANTVNLNQVKFRFVLHESLPVRPNLESHAKGAIEREKNFELLKAWVDFRHYLFAHLDPNKGAKVPLEKQNIYSIQSRHVKTLAMLQKNNKIQSVFNALPAHLDELLAFPDSTKPVQPVHS